MSSCSLLVPDRTQRRRQILDSKQKSIVRLFGPMWRETSIQPPRRVHNRSIPLGLGLFVILVFRRYNGNLLARDRMCK
ncbi:hypothetical protein RSAG8_00529, partial [Rhizoctonia solani AG-8 WAC10335]